MKISRRQMLKYLLSGAVAATLRSQFSFSRADGENQSRQWIMTGSEIKSLAVIDQTIQTYMQDRSIPGCTLAITRHGKLMFARGYSWTTNADEIVYPDSLFRIASLTKPFTSAAVLSLVDGNKVKLSDKIADILTLKTVKGQQIPLQLYNITLLYLLQHLGGWDRDTTFDPMFYDNEISQAMSIPLPISAHDIITYMNGQPLQFTPGTQYVYSNYGYCLLGRIIEQIANQPYEDYVTNTILKPLNIQHMKLGYSLLSKRQSKEVLYYTEDTGLFPSVLNPHRKVAIPYGTFNLENMDSHGRWLASAIDLMRFAVSFDTSATKTVLSAGSISQIFAMPNIGANSDGSYYGCGWSVRPAGNSFNTWHTGSLPGTTTLLVRRWDGVNWAILFNQRDDPSGKSYDVIDGLMHSAVDAVSAWPDHDLFDQFD